MSKPKKPTSEFSNPKGISIFPAGKSMPCAIDMEQCILGAILLESPAIDKVSEILTAVMFHDAANREIFEACTELRLASKPIDLIVAKNHLQFTKRLESVGGVFYLTELTSKVASSANIVHHALTVAQKYMAREAIKIGAEAMEFGLDDATDIVALINHLQSKLEVLQPSMSPMESASDLVFPVINDVEAAMRGETKSLYMGFDDFDKDYAFEPGDLVVLGAGSGTGKTAFALQVCKRMAAKYRGMPIIFNSLEMKGKKIISRDMASSIGVSQMRFRTGNNIGQHEIEKMVGMSSEYDGIYFVQCWNNDELAAKVRQLKRQLSLPVDAPMVVISDYAQIMSGTKGGNREQEVASISRSAKKLAEDESLVYFLLSQLNKEAGKDRPRQSNLRESAGLGNDADWVILLYSPWRNDVTTYDDGSSTEGILEAILEKVRFGMPGAIIRLSMSKHGLIGDLNPRTPSVDSLNLPRIQPKDFSISRHHEDQPKDEGGGGGDFFPY